MVRLNKYLADCGVCARRKADALIERGAVRVDGRVARVGDSIDPSNARVTVGGRPVAAPPAQHRTLVLNKPRGVVTTLRDERGRRCVADLLPKSPRYFPVGRLDADSTGVLLCTTDGELARVLTHPSFGVEKVYRVRASGALTDQTKAALGAHEATTRADGTHSFTMALREGRNRQVRRMCAQRGLRVVDLERITFGPVRLGELRQGAMRPPTSAERVELELLVKRARADEKSLKPASHEPPKKGARSAHRMNLAHHGGSRDTRRRHGAGKRTSGDRRGDEPASP